MRLFILLGIFIYASLTIETVSCVASDHARSIDISVLISACREEIHLEWRGPVVSKLHACDAVLHSPFSLHVANIAAELFGTVALLLYYKPLPLLSSIVLFHTCIVWLKLVSYVDVNSVRR